MASDPDPDELAALRREYGDAGLDDPDLAPDPVAMFRHWMHDAVVAGLHEPNAMVVSTVVARGPPVVPDGAAQGARRARLRLLHQLRLPQGPRPRRRPAIALLFPWHDLQRQVRVEGTREPGAATRRAEAYFATRPRASQLGAWASPQSDEVASRAELQAAYDEAELRFAGQDVPLPPNWGGFRVRPDLVEFWQGRRGRMHDRLVYRRDGDAWTTAAGADGAGWRRSHLDETPLVACE